MVIAGSTLGTLIPYAFSSRLVQPSGAGNPSSLNGLDRSVVGNSSSAAAWASNLTAAASIALPLALDFADQGTSSAFLEDAVIMTEVISVTGALATSAKYAFQRRTPQLYTAQGAALATSAESYKSFYSAQTAVTFAALSTAAFTLSHRYDQKVWPWVATAVIGAGVGAERVASGRAFYTDVLAGAAAGVAAGTLIPWLHLRSGVTGAVTPADGGVAVSALGKF
jgi:hypothetical protein